MKKKVFLVLFAIMTVTTALSQRYNYTAVSPSGQTLYYSIYDGQAKVVWPERCGTGSSADLWCNRTRPTGILIIPDEVNGSPVKEIDDAAFKSCTGLVSVVIGRNVTRIGENAFLGCSNLTSVTFPDSLRTIESYAFEGCSLNRVELPNEIESIGFRAFRLCPIDTIIITSEIPPILQNTENGGPYWVAGVNLLVPCGYSGVYDTVSGYQDCNIQELTCSYNVNIIESDSNMGIIVGLGGLYISGDTVELIAVPSIGYHFMNWSNGITFNPYTIVVTSDTTIYAIYAPNDTIKIHDTTIVLDTLYLDKYIHDTTYVPIHDTTILYLRDTLITNHYTYDTSIYNHFRYDTTLVFDTMIINVYTYDTSIYNNYQFDTVILNYYQYDTTLVNVFDTTIVNVYDTTIVNIYDTTINNLYQYDTVIVNNYVYDTVIVNHYYYDTTIVNNHDTVNNYFYDTVIITHYYHDTVIVNNYVYDTIYLNRYIFDTVWMYDTVIVHDTIYITQESIDGAEMLNAKVYSSNGQIVVEGAEGNTVTLYDVNGRVLAIKQDDYMPLRFDVHVSGTYMIKIGNYPARKVVVIR